MSSVTHQQNLLCIILLLVIKKSPREKRGGYILERVKNVLIQWQVKIGEGHVSIFLWDADI